MYNLIVAVDQNNGISRNNLIPWNIKQDLQYFKDKTIDSYVIMGKNTWLSLKKPLSNRINIVISSTLTKNSQNNPDYIFSDFKSCLLFLRSKNCKLKNTFDYSPLYNMYSEEKQIYIIGGSQLYNEAILYNECNYIYVTEIYNNYNCDNFFCTIPNNFFFN